MKKILLAISLILLFCITKSQTISIGSGTSTGGFTVYSPYNPYFGYSYAQTIYLQNELTGSGNITSIKYYYIGTSLSSSDSVKVYMGTVARTSFASVTDWEPLANLTLVFDGKIPSTTLPGFITIPLTTPFPYSNSGNLLIAVDENRTGFEAGSTNSFRGSSVTPANRVLYYASDATNPDPASPPSGSRSSNIGNIQIDGLTLIGCQPPSALTVPAASVTANSATINWTAPTTLPAGGYQYYYNTTGTAPVTDVVPSGTAASNVTTTNLSGLAGGSTFYVWLRSICGAGDSSRWEGPVSFITKNANDECATAATVTVNTGTTCTSVVSGTVSGATASAGPASSCGTYDDDVWFKFVAGTSTQIITLQNLAGSTTDLTFQVLDACGATTALICSDPQTATLSGLTPGNTYYLRVATYTSTVGQTSTFDVCITTPANMSYVSSTTTQPSTATVAAGSLNQQIIRVAVVVNGLTSPLNLTSIDFNTNGSTNPAVDIANAKVYYTGTSTTFSTTTQFGGTVANPSGPFTVTGSQALTGGTSATTNYFWLVYDVACGATGGDLLDAEATSINVGGPQTPTATAPTGTRAITAAAYTATTSQASTASVLQGSTNAQIMYVTVNGCAGSSVTQINFTTGTSTNATTDITAARVFYTTTTTFATTTPFGSAVANPNGAFSVTGSQPLATGTGYFWLVYDISPTATAGDLIDASATSAVVNGITATPTTTNPTGTRTVIAPLVNDEAAGAILLTVGGGCTGNPYDNTIASQSANEPFPSCKGTAGYGGMWYKFVAPASGAVKVSDDGTGSFGDSRISLFSAINVNDYTTFTNIACDDDNGVTGTTRSLLYATGLTAGTTYYVVVDLYSSSSTRGTYCVTIDELSSTMLSTTAASCSADQASVAAYNTTYTGWISLVDAAGNLNALVRQTAGTATGFASSRTIVTGASRVDGQGIPYLNRNFLINATGGTTTADVQFFFTTAELTSLGIALGNVNVSRVAGTACTGDFAGAAGLLPQTRSGTANGANWVQVTTPGFSNFFLHAGSIPLPVSLVYFQGRKIGAGNAINWKVNCTSTRITMVVERSSDARNFAAIGNIVADQARCLQPFDLTDVQPAKGTNYYRLKMIDIDGSVSYSSVVAIINGDKGVEFVGVYPTIVNSSALLSVASAKPGKIHTTITDMTGKLIKSVDYTVVEGSNLIKLDCSALAAGTYNITGYVDAARTKTLRFVKL